MRTLSSGRWLNESENKGINIITSKIHIESSTVCYIWHWNFFHLCNRIKSLENYLRRIVVLIFCIKANFIKFSVLLLFINRIKQYKQFNLGRFFILFVGFCGVFLVVFQKVASSFRKIYQFPFGLGLWQQYQNI